MATSSIVRNTIERQQTFNVKPRKAFLANEGIKPVIDPDEGMSNAFSESVPETKSEMKREDSLKWSQTYLGVQKTKAILPKNYRRRSISFVRDIDESRDDYIMNEVEKASIKAVFEIVKNAESLSFMNRQAKAYFKTQTALLQSGLVDTTTQFTTPVKPLDILVLKSQIERYDATLLTDTQSIINILRTPELVRFVLVRSRMTNLTPEKKQWFELFKKVAERVAIANRLFRVDWTQTPEQYDATPQPTSGSGSTGYNFPSGMTAGEGFAMSAGAGFDGRTGSAPMSAGAGFDGRTGSAPPTTGAPFFERADDPSRNPHPNQPQPDTTYPPQSTPVFDPYTGARILIPPTGVYRDFSQPDTTYPPQPTPVFDPYTGARILIPPTGVYRDFSQPGAGLSVPRFQFDPYTGARLPVQPTSQPSGSYPPSSTASQNPPPSPVITKTSTEVFDSNTLLYDPETNEATRQSKINMEDIVNSSQSKSDAIRRLYEYLKGRNVLPVATLYELEKEINDTRPSVGSGRRLLEEDLEYIFEAIKKVLPKMNYVKDSEMSKLSTMLNNVGTSPTSPPSSSAPSILPRSSSAPSTQTPSSSSQSSTERPSLKMQMLDIIKSEQFKDEAIRKIYRLLQTPGIIPIAVHATLERSVKAINKSAESVRYTTEDLRQIWIKIRQILLETKVFDGEIIAELRSAMDEKIQTITQANPLDSIQNKTPSYTIFEPDDTFIDATYDCVLTMFISLMYIPSNWQDKANYLEFFKQVAYLPNGFTFRIITEIVRTFAGGTSTLFTFTNLVANFLSVISDPANTGIRKFDWVGVALGNQLSLFIFGCLGTGANTLLRIFFANLWKGKERFRVSLETWFLLILWILCGRYKGQNLLTFAQIIQRAGQCGTIDYQRWVNFLINCFVEVDKRVQTSRTNDEVLDSFVNEIGANAVFQIVEWMNKPFDLQRIPVINQEAVESNIPPKTIELEAPKLGFTAERLMKDNMRQFDAEEPPQPMGKEVSNYKNVENDPERLEKLKGIYENLNDLATINSWGIKIDVPSVNVILDMKSRIDATAKSFTHSLGFRSVQGTTFVEYSVRPSQPLLPKIILAIWMLCKDAVNLVGTDASNKGFTDLIMNPKETTAFTINDVKAYGMKYFGFLYNCILMFLAKGILEDIDSDKIDFVFQLAKTISVLLRIFADADISIADTFSDTIPRKKIEWRFINILLDKNIDTFKFEQPNP